MYPSATLVQTPRHRQRVERGRSSVPQVGKIALCAWVLLLAGCKKSHPVPSQVDCKEDLDCYIARARECLPTSVVHQGLYPLDWSAPDNAVLMTVQYEVKGRVQGRCHVLRTQLQPSWEWPDAGPRP